MSRHCPASAGRTNTLPSLMAWHPWITACARNTGEILLVSLAAVTPERYPARIHQDPELEVYLRRETEGKTPTRSYQRLPTG